MKSEHLHIGTCSWKYESWQGLVYSKQKPENLLAEYSQKYSTVEVDQWFWSLFADNKVVLPKVSVVKEYAASVPDHFKFAIKIPNSITLTHYYKKHRTDQLIPNPHFLSTELLEKFLVNLEPLSGKIGPLMFQFEYLNKQKISGLEEFTQRFGEFAESLPSQFTYCVEIRNPNYLSQKYFTFLRDNNLRHVFLQGYYMPSIFKIYKEHRDSIRKLVVIRLLGGDRKSMEEKTGKKWDIVVEPRDSEIATLADMLNDLEEQHTETYLFVNNHFEGSAPRTISKIEHQLVKT